MIYISNTQTSEVEILPNFFRHSRFQSLVRQLNFYAFKKVSKERSSWVYSHTHFQQHRPDLLDKLRRKTNGICVKRASGYSQGGDDCLQRKKRRLASSTDKFSSDESSDENYEGTSIDRADSFGSSGDKYWTGRRVVCFGKAAGVSGRGQDSDEDDMDASSTDDSVEVNYENIHRSWDNVHQYFTESTYDREESVAVGGTCESLSTEASAPPSIPPAETPDGLCPNRCISKREGVAEEGEGKEGGGDYRRRLLLFCSERNPWEHSQGLFADIHSLLSEDDSITKELNAYVSALSPSSMSCKALAAGLGVSPTLRQEEDGACEGQEGADRHVTVGAHSLGAAVTTASCILRANEVTVVRTFMAFALACMHEAEGQQQAEALDSSSAGSSSDVLGSCVDRWAGYARVCS